MSAKYQRIKQADLALPAPLRWLTRAFSSVTLAICLLSLVLLYGIAASVPFFFLMVGGIDVLIAIPTLGVAAVAVILIIKRGHRLNFYLKLALGAALLGAGAWVAMDLWLTVYRWAMNDPFMMRNSAEVVYRLPFFEMTEQQFYAWWPMKLLLILFVLNMVWATLRRIEFKFVNIGVLTVHTGIVILAIGSILYGHFKLEGTTVLWRKDVGGQWVNYFYDGSEPALYASLGNQRVMLPVPQLPRWNDYDVDTGSLNIEVSDDPQFKKIFGDKLKVRIPGFIAYGTLTRDWQSLSEQEARTHHARTTDVLELAAGGANGPMGPTQALVADAPAHRVIEGDSWALDFLDHPSSQRIKNLLSQFSGLDGLVVDIPAVGFRQVYAIKPGQTIQCGDTGYTLSVEKIGPYPLPFVSRDYQGATDTRAIVHVTGHDKNFTRIVMYRYPERSQDFHPTASQAGPEESSTKVRIQPASATAQTPESPESPEAAALSAMSQSFLKGLRTDPDPAIRLTYLNRHKLQLHVYAEDANLDQLKLLVEVPQVSQLDEAARFHAVPFIHPIDNDLIPLPSQLAAQGDASRSLYIVKRLPRAVQVAVAKPTPKLNRDPKNEGTYISALVPVELSLDRPASEGGPWKQLVWLHNMQFLDFPDDIHRPAIVDVPGVGQVTLAFSRVRHSLPFAMRLASFKMTPYPGSDIPRDYASTVAIQDLTPQGEFAGEPVLLTAKLNNPIHHTARYASLRESNIKLSQASWDPGNPRDPNNDATDAQGRFLHKERFTVLMVGNNVGIHIVALGAILMVLGIPWAFWVKPWLVQRKKVKIQRQLQADANQVTCEV